MCYCRHKMEHLKMACDAPMEVCMTFNHTGDALIRHEYARRIDASEALEILELAYENNLCNAEKMFVKGLALSVIVAVVVVKVYRPL